MLDRLRGVPGVEAVSSAEYNVLGRAWTYNVRVPGTQHETIEATMAPVTPGFFETMKIPVRAGRAFVPRDMGAGNAPAPSSSTRPSPSATSAASPPSVVRSRGASREADDRPGMHEVVGVVADTRYDLRKPAAPTIYIPLRLRSNGTVHVRVAGDPAALAARLREEVRAASPLFRVTTVTSQSAVVDQTLLRERLLGAALRLLRGRRPGAGGRRAVRRVELLGRAADARDWHSRRARRAPARRGPDGRGGSRRRRAGRGRASGWRAALYLSRFVESLLFEVTPLDFWSLALPLGTLLLAALLAATLPALRAARVDPVIALRYE